jgi:ATP-binding cassette subfamily B (MDR/TAP) protein 1
LRLLELPTETNESKGDAKPQVHGHIAFRNVSFAYPSRPNVPVLRDLSLDIRPGECVGVVGASGSGKSTVAALLQRLYEPTGEILLDGVALASTAVHHVRAHLAVVSQHPALFDMAIADNIAYGLDPAAHDAATVAPVAARKAHIHEWITSLPNAYRTALGENANLVSGGQAQRLQIARALAREREVLILDECTSALDTANSAAVMKTIAEVKAGRTTVVITHKVRFALVLSSSASY